MAIQVRSRRRSTYAHDLGRLVTDYLRDADAGRAVDADGAPLTAAGLRSLRRSLVHVQAHATGAELAAADALGATALERLACQIVDDAGLPRARVVAMVAALRGLSAYASADTWADLPPRPRDLPPRRSEPAEATPSTGSPTYAMLALGAQAGAWMQRIIVIAFVLTAIGLALALV
jgi:hypothetical protein